MISQVALPDAVLRIFVIAVVVSVAVLAMIGFLVRKTSKKMGLTDSTAGCLAIFVPILLVMLAVWGLSIFNQYQSPSVEPHQPEDLPQYEQEMRQELEMQRMNSL